MKQYGSYSDADLDYWERLPLPSEVLTQSAFGAWLMRRDENKAKQFPTVSLDKVKQAREEIENEVKFWSEPPKAKSLQSVKAVKDGKVNSYRHCLEILDKLIESEK